MDNPISIDPLLGNRLFDFEAATEWLPIWQQDLATAREEAKVYAGANQEGNYNWGIGQDGTIDPVAAGEIYQAIRLFVEDDVLNLAERHSPAAWLWYLRKLPLFFFDFEDSPASAYVTSDLAETMSALAQTHVLTDPESIKPFRYKMDPQVMLDLLRLCGKIHVLRKTHQRIRTAGKEVKFRYIPGDFPVPFHTESQQRALCSYDQRSARGTLFALLATRTGTPIMAPGTDTDAIVVPIKDFAGSLAITKEAFDNYGESFSPSLRLNRTAEHVQVPTKFTLYEMSLPHLKLFSTEHLDAAAHTEAAELIILLRLARKMIHDNPIYGVDQASQNGYILDEAELVLERLGSSIDELVGFAHQLIPAAQVPANAQDFLDDLEAMTGSSWPWVHGPVIRRGADSLLIDFYSAWKRLEHTLSFKKDVPAPLPKQRGTHFEDQVQRMIDVSPWGNVPKKLRELRKRKHLKRADGTALTDIDAIGVLGDTVLIVECKSWIETADVFLGTHSFASNAALKLEVEVKKCRNVENYLREHPRHHSGSYDFSAFKNIVVVLCTTAPVYAELEMVRSAGRSAGLEFSELLSTQEVMPGLLASTSVSELGEWLYSPHVSS